MKFPAYIPEVIKKQVINYLEGDGDFEGWISCIDKYEKELKENKTSQDRHINNKNSSSPSTEHILNGLRLEHNKINEHYLSLKRNVDCIKRLIDRPEMEDVYQALVEDINDDSLIDKFFQSAWAANVDYQPYRERKK